MTRSEPSTIWQDLRSLPVSFWVLFWGTFVNRAGLFVYPFLTFLMGRQGFQDYEIGYALGGYGIGALLATGWGGWGADRFGRKGCIVIGSLLNGVAVILLGQISTLPVLCVLTSLAGFANAFSYPALSSFVADVVPEPQRLRAFAAYRLAVNAGFFCGMALGGWLVTKSAWILFWGDGITTFVYGGIAAWLLPNTGKVAKEQASWRSAFRQLRALPAFWLVMVMEMSLSAIWGQFSTTFGRHVQQLGAHLEIAQLGIAWGPERVYSLLLGWNGLLIVFLELFVTRWTQRISTMSILLLGFLLQGLGFLGYAVPWGVFWLFGCMTMFTLGEIIFAPVHSAFVARITPEAIRGRSQGILQFGQCLMRIVAPTAGFLLLARGPYYLWGTCFGIAVLGGAAAWLAARKE